MMVNENNMLGKHARWYHRKEILDIIGKQFVEREIIECSFLVSLTICSPVQKKAMSCIEMYSLKIPTFDEETRTIERSDQQRYHELEQE